MPVAPSAPCPFSFVHRSADQEVGALAGRYPDLRRLNVRFSRNGTVTPTALPIHDTDERGATFRELRKAEVQLRRTLLPHTRVNKGRKPPRIG
jgi:hypothetical protein